MNFDIDDIRRTAHPAYPAGRIPPGARDVLLLFGAGFGGRNDGVHYLSAGLHGTVVDSDPFATEAMEAAYPAGWDFVVDDVFQYAVEASMGSETWDCVSVDCPLALVERCATLAPLWQRLARSLLTVTTVYPHDEAYAFEGWRLLPRVPRNDTANWAVYVRD